MENNCPICGNPLEPINEPGLEQGDYEFFNCASSCGKFELSRSLLKELPRLLKEDGNRVFLLSHFLRKMNAGKEIPFLNADLFNNILHTSLPSLPDQTKYLVLWLGKNTAPGERTEYPLTLYQAVMGAKSVEGTRFVIDHLVDGNYLSAEIYGSGESEVGLSMKGWDYFEQLNRGAILSRKVFMAMQYGDPELDTVFEHCFKPAVKATGFELARMDETPQAGLIDDRMRVEIRTSRFLIADLTHENRGAYWEAGFAEGLGKPVIYTCEKSKFGTHKTHFDTNHHETVVWEKDKLEIAARKLKVTIRATLPDEAAMHDAPDDGN